MPRLTFIWLAATLTGFSTSSATAQQQQTADVDFDARVGAPAYTTEHPAVLFDEAHNNLHTTGGLYRPFVEIISNDGYRVQANKKEFSTDVLQPCRILVIANASGSLRDEAKASDSPFTAAECKAVDAWVRQGGSLLLITDHYQYGAAAQPLARAFGVDMSQVETLDPPNTLERKAGKLLFAQENGLLGDHPIIWGRGPSEQVHRVVTYSGQSLLGPRASAPFLLLSDTAFDRSKVDNSTASAAGRSQGLSIFHGKGRVVVLGEAAVLSAQIFQGQATGMNEPGNDNRQLALNIMHWLSGLTPVNNRTAKQPAASRRGTAARKKARSGAGKTQAPQPERPVEDP